MPETSSVLGAPASLIGSELPPHPRYGAPALLSALLHLSAWKWFSEAREGAQEAAIGTFLLAHEGHTQDVEVQRGAWTIYCRCTRCEDVHTYEVDNEAWERALGLPHGRS